jgi:hypothetical protein
VKHTVVARERVPNFNLIADVYVSFNKGNGFPASFVEKLDALEIFFKRFDHAFSTFTSQKKTQTSLFLFETIQ